MWVKYNGDEWAITFTHEIKEVWVGKSKKRGITTAAVLKMVRGHGTQGYFGVAYCSDRDQFSKEAGRTQALGRAMELMPEELAQQVSVTYANRKLSGRPSSTEDIGRLSDYESIVQGCRCPTCRALRRMLEKGE